MAKRMRKGEPGKGTGGTARKLIRAAEKKGLTHEQIGRGSNRNGSTIGQIKRGDIKNPPNSLLPQLRRVAKRKKK